MPGSIHSCTLATKSNLSLNEGHFSQKVSLIEGFFIFLQREIPFITHKPFTGYFLAQ